jgi:hypothetical protein
MCCPRMDARSLVFLMSELRRDLARRIREKHRLWLKDSVALYQMADLPMEEATYDVLYTLIVTLISGLKANGVTQEQALAMLDEWIARLEKDTGTASR